MPAQLLVQGAEIGIATTNLDAMLGFYERFLGLERAGSLDFAGGTQLRFKLGDSTLKLVSYDEDPPGEVVPGGGRAARGIRYLSLVVGNLREIVADAEAAGIEIGEPLTEFQPGIGFAFLVDPDGNWIELAGPI